MLVVSQQKHLGICEWLTCFTICPFEQRLGAQALRRCYATSSSAPAQKTGRHSARCSKKSTKRSKKLSIMVTPSQPRATRRRQTRSAVTSDEDAELSEPVVVTRKTVRRVSVTAVEPEPGEPVITSSRTPRQIQARTPSPHTVYCHGRHRHGAIMVVFLPLVCSQLSCLVAVGFSGC